MGTETQGYINAGINAASGIAGGIASIVNTNKTIKANKQMAEYAYGKDLEMWNRNNQYNTPAMQMQRFKEGGLNPNLIYGQGNSGNATSMPKYQTPKMDYNYKAPDFSGVVGAYQDTQIKNAQVDNIKANTQTAIAREINLGYDSILKDIKGMTSQKQLTWTDRNLEQNYRKNEETISQMKGLSELRKSQSDINKVRLPLERQVILSRLNYQISQLENTQARTNALQTWQKSEGISRSAKNWGEVYKNPLQMKNIQADIAVKESIRSLNAMKEAIAPWSGASSIIGNTVLSGAKLVRGWKGTLTKKWNVGGSTFTKTGYPK
jgi:hypothetical protein